MKPTCRADTYERTSAALRRLSGDELAAVLTCATSLPSGIGGEVSTLDVDGVRVFAKSIPLSDLEVRNLHSTANLFSLPTFCQYGVGSPGFGSWRELAAHVMTTAWVLADDCPSFPLLFHWRVLPRVAKPSLSVDEEKDVEGQYVAWGHSAPMRERLTARYLATNRIVLFLEHVPHTVHSWLGARAAARDTAAVEMVERELLAVTSFMNARGLLHFDAHFQNILTDGERLYFSDFGLALSSTFELASEEVDLFTRHRDFDRSYVVTVLRDCLREAEFDIALDERYERVATVMRGFFDSLMTQSKTTPYPADELASAWRA